MIFVVYYLINSSTEDFKIPQVRQMIHVLYTYLNAQESPK